MAENLRGEDGREEEKVSQANAAQQLPLENHHLKNSHCCSDQCAAFHRWNDSVFQLLWPYCSFPKGKLAKRSFCGRRLERTQETKPSEKANNTTGQTLFDSLVVWFDPSIEDAKVTFTFHFDVLTISTTSMWHGDDRTHWNIGMMRKPRQTCSLILRSSSMRYKVRAAFSSVRGSTLRPGSTSPGEQGAAEVREVN